MNNLYIIGNGFDLHHGIPSSYNSFRDYLDDVDSNTYQILIKYIQDDNLWSDFEQCLANFDTESLIDNHQDSLVSYVSDEWSDSYHHEFQYFIQETVEALTTKLKEHFTNWVLQLGIEEDYREYKKTIRFKDASIYLNFNYTDTLESIYGIDENSILYIHNKACNRHSNLILGHSRNPREFDSFNNRIINKSSSECDENEYYEEDDYDDVRYAEGIKLIDSYFEKTYKSTSKIIKENINFFKNLKDIRVINILGHSLSDVDMPYFKKIVESVDIDRIKWKATYFFEFEKEHHLRKLMELGIKEDKINIVTMHKFEK